MVDSPQLDCVNLPKYIASGEVICRDRGRLQQGKGNDNQRFNYLGI